MALPLPPFFDLEAVSRVYRVPYQQRADEARAWAEAHGLRPAAEDRERVALLLIDVQNTFCLPEFELFVAGRSGRGAVEDAPRIATLLYRRLDRVTQVVATLDTHAAATLRESRDQGRRCRRPLRRRERAQREPAQPPGG